ncbi:MAG: type II secretion system GspH family protein [Chthoniobacterales bacterium]|nr:type II secretion system GspH family protein [Chthoniobacterales bacterium]MCX7713531.1 type II secretion system GspH family protein [Chthoniobacterales bacterium]
MSHKYDLNLKKGFSLVELLAAVAIIGIISFLAIPNIIKMRQDSEQSLAQARVEALNLALAAFVQANGFSSANSTWSNATNNESRYQILKPYLSFSENTLSTYMKGRSVNMPSSLTIPLPSITLNSSN